VRKFSLILTLLTLLTAFCAIIALSVGRFSVPFLDVLAALLNSTGFNFEVASNAQNVIENLRLPRVIAAVLVGAALSISGVAYQGVFRNQLVSPDLLGVSAGACVGAAIAIVLDLGLFWIQSLAFICVCVSSTKLSQAPHCGHLPIHLLCCAPQAWHSKTLLDFAI